MKEALSKSDIFYFPVLINVRVKLAGLFELVSPLSDLSGLKLVGNEISDFFIVLIVTTLFISYFY